MNSNINVGVNLAFSANTEQVKKELNSLRQSLENISNIGSTKTNFAKPMMQEMKEAAQAARELKSYIDAATNVETGKLDLGVFSRSIQQSGKQLQDFGIAISKIGPEGQSAFHQMTNSILQAEMPLRRTSKLLQRFATTFANTARYQLSARILSGFTGALQSAFSYAKDLNESLNNIRIVTGQSTDQMAEFAKQANKAAQALSTTTTEYTNASLIFYQQGLTGNDVTERVDTVIKLANVTGQSAEDISSYMTAIWNNFADGSETLEHYADVITNLGANTASSSREIAEGLEKFAAVGQTVGLSYDYATTALATVVAQTRQSADIVGNAFKTLFSRLQGLSLGETLDDGTTLNKYSEALGKVGIDIKEQNGELKAADKILDEMGAKWQTLNKDQQMALAQSVAGVRQYTQLVALMNNWNKFQQNLGYAEGAEGSLQKQADIYAESWEAARDRVKAAAEQIYNQLLDDQFFIDLNNGLTDFLNLLSKLIQSLGGLKGVLSSISAIVLTLFKNQIGQGVNTVLYNLRDPKKIAEQQRRTAINAQGEVNKVIGDRAEGEGLDYTVQGYDKLFEAQQKYAENASKMSDAEKMSAQSALQELENRIKLIKAIEEENIKRKQKLELAEQEKEIAKSDKQEKVVAKASREDDIITAEKAKKKAQQKIKAGQENIDLIRKNIESPGIMGSKYIKTSMAPDGLKDSIDKLKKLDSNSKEYKETVKALKNAIKEIETDIKSYNTEINNQDKVIEKAKKGIEDYEQEIKELDDIIAQPDKINIEISDAADEAKNGLDQVTDGAIKFNQAMDQVDLKTVDYGSHIVGLAQGVSSLFMALNAIKGMGDILTDDSLTVFEKASSIITTVSFVIPMLTNGFISFTNSLKEIPTLLIQATAALSGHTAAEVIATGVTQTLTGTIKAFGLAVKKAIVPLLPIIVPITIALTGLVAIYTALKIEEKALQREQEALKNSTEQLKNTYQELNNTLNGLSSSFDQYKSAIEILNKCAISTKEWKEQLEKVNEEVLNIIDKYPQLLQYVSRDKNGVLSIDQGAWQNIINETQNKVIKFRATSQLADLNNQNYEANKKTSSFTNLIEDIFVEQGSNENIESNLTRDQIKNKLDEHINELVNLTDTEFIQQIEKIFGINVKMLSQNLIDYKKQINDYVNDLDIIETKRKNALMISNVIDVDTYGEAAATIASDMYQAQIDELKKAIEKESQHLSWWNKTENTDVQKLLKRYIEASGIEGLTIDASNAVLGHVWNRRYRFQTADNKTKEVTQEELVNTIATYEALDKLNGKAAEAMQTLNSLLNDQKVTIESFISNNKNFSQLTKEQINDILQFNGENGKDAFQTYLGWSDTEKDSKATTLGNYENFEDFYNAIIKGAENYITGERNLTNNLLPTVKELFRNLDSEELTLSARKSIANLLQDVFQYGGRDAAKQTNEMLANMSVETREKAVKILSSVGTSSDIESVIKDFEEAGISIKGFENNLSTFVAAMRNGVTQFAQVAEKYAAIHKIIDKLNLGDTISAEDYATLGDNAKYYFDLMADGTYQLTKDAREFYDLTQNELLKKYENELKALLAKQDKLKIPQEYNTSYLDYFKSGWISNMTQPAAEQLAGQRVEAIMADYGDIINASGEKDKFDLLKNNFLTNPRSVQAIDALNEFLSNLIGNEDNIKAAIQQGKEETKIQALALLGAQENSYDIDSYIENSDAFKEIGEKFGQAFLNEIVQEAKEKYFEKDFFKDLDSSKFKELGDQLQNLQNLKDNISDSMDNSASERLAASVLRIANGIKDINSNWEEWNQEIKEDGDNATEAILGLKEATAELFGVKSEYLRNVLTKDFLSTNSELIQSAAAGIEKSFTELRQNLIEAILTSSFTPGQRDNVRKFLNQIRYETKNLDYGDTTTLTNVLYGHLNVSGQKTGFEQLLEAVGLHVTDWTGPSITLEKVADALFAQQFSDKTGTDSSSKKNAEYLEEVFDRYWDINNAISRTTQSLTELEQKMTKLTYLQDKTFGDDLIENLKEENKLLDDQIKLINKEKDNYEKLYDIQEGELRELMQGIFESEKKESDSLLSTLIFDKNGKLKEGQFESKLTEAKRLYNQAVTTFNNSSKSDSDQEALDRAKEDYDLRKKFFDRYQQLYYNEMYETQNKLAEDEQKIREIQLKQTQNTLKAWETGYQIKFDANELQRLENDFAAELKKDFKLAFEDLTINKQNGLDNLTTYYDDIANIKKEIQEIESGAIKFETESAAQAKLDELNKRLIEDLKTAREEVKKLWENYLSGIDQVESQLDEINKQYTRINNQLNYEKELIEIVYGDQAYDKLHDFYDIQRQANLSNIESLKSQVAFEKEQLDIAMKEAGFTELNISEMNTWSDDMKKFYDQWQDAQEKLNDTILEGAKLIKEEFLNNLNEIFKTMDNNIWGMSYEDMKSDWDYIQNKSKEYLDDVVGAYKIQTLANKIDQSIAGSNNLKYQQRLQEFREEEIKYLREKENLTQTDLDIAEARYELLVKEMELEEAKQNKNTIKLARDASGNWSYQYVADEEQTLAKQQELSDAYNKLYETANEGYIHSIELAQQAYEEMQQEMTSLAEKGELTKEKFEEIYNKYYEDFRIAVDNAEEYRREAATTSSAHFGYLADIDSGVYQSLTELQKKLVSDMDAYCFETYEDLRKEIQDTPLVKDVFEEFNYTAGSVADSVIDKWINGEGSVQTAFASAIAKVHDLLDWYNEAFNELNKTLGGENSPLKTINTDLKNMTEQFGALESATQTYCENAGKYLEALRTGDIQKTIDKINEMNNALSNDDPSKNKDKEPEKTDTLDNTGNNDGDGNNIYTESEIRKIAQGIAGSIWYDNKLGSDTYNWGNDPVRQDRINSIFGELGDEIYKELRIALDEYQNNKARYDKYTEAYRDWDYNTIMTKGTPFATGGYTGEWGSTGKVAILHEKELVLNAEDTSNLLQAVGSIRDLARLNDSIDAAIATSIGRLALDLVANAGAGASYGQTSAAADNTFYITAEFPNANDVETIREAILSLPNLAAQYLGQR